MISIIDYKAGNAPSVLNAVHKLGLKARLCPKPEFLRGASHIILPGVGSAGATMRSLAESGFLSALSEAVLQKNIPYLGICVGMQILFEYSHEENTECLGWLKGNVIRFDSTKVRVPQMGWNKVRFTKPVPFNCADNYFYFVNSFYAVPQDKADIWGTAEYGTDFTAAVNRGNIYGTQFHAEKSGAAGLELLRGFLQC
ncbi:MAG: imidazole glycerol phosphate synthase subunit HisH [Firmicutes bacterium]|nr:imidazole glycerol phosphate synthase subunit HisH [Bacillota bacterium]